MGARRRLGARGLAVLPGRADSVDSGRGSDLCSQNVFEALVDHEAAHLYIRGSGARGGPLEAGAAEINTLTTEGVESIYETGDE